MNKKVIKLMKSSLRTKKTKISVEIPNHSKTKDRNKFFLYISTLINKIVNLPKNLIKRIRLWLGSPRIAVMSDDISSIGKDILGYGIIGYPAYYLIFIHNNIVMEILGCGSIYYLVRDFLDFVVSEIIRMGKKQ